MIPVSERSGVNVTPVCAVAPRPPPQPLRLSSICDVKLPSVMACWARVYLYGQAQSHVGFKAHSGYLFVLQDALNTCMYSAHGATFSA